jgi:hypothetical protein
MQQCRPAASPFAQAVETAGEAEAFAALLRGRTSTPASVPGGVALATLRGFDLDERPLLAGVSQLPGELVAARSTVALRRNMVGASVVIVHVAGDPLQPIVIGVLHDEPSVRPVNVQVDGEALVLEAEREIVLRCGEASITLTRAGKVLIQGSYVSSRSSGCNRIKGAAIDIN